MRIGFKSRSWPLTPSPFSDRVRTMAKRPQLLLTNDDGIDSVGLHVLARSVQHLGDVTIVAPDSEYSGAGAAIGAIWEMKPEVHKVKLDGFENVWSVSGPPALCVMFARMGAFGFTPDLIVSGINPGANVGRSVYHSGTIGACLTGRNGGVSGVAVSQKVDNFGVEGQAWADTITNLKWQTAADVAAVAVEAMLESPPAEPRVLNVNVPNLPTEELGEWVWTQVGNRPPRSFSTALLEPKIGHENSFTVKMEFGDSLDQPDNSDTGAMLKDQVSLTWLSQIQAMDEASTTAETAAVNAHVAKLLSAGQETR